MLWRRCTPRRCPDWWLCIPRFRSGRNHRRACTEKHHHAALAVEGHGGVAGVPAWARGHSAWTGGQIAHVPGRARAIQLPGLDVRRGAHHVRCVGGHDHPATQAIVGHDREREVPKSTKSPLSRKAHPADRGSHSQKTLLLVVPCQVLSPSKRNIFCRPSSKAMSGPPPVPPLDTGATFPGVGVRLVQVVFAPSHSQTALLGTSPPKSSNLARPESVTMPAPPTQPGLDAGESWLHARVALLHSQVSQRSRLSRRRTLTGRSARQTR